MEFAITGPMQSISSDNSWLLRGARSFFVGARDYLREVSE